METADALEKQTSFKRLKQKSQFLQICQTGHPVQNLWDKSEQIEVPKTYKYAKMRKILEYSNAALGWRGKNKEYTTDVSNIT